MITTSILGMLIGFLSNSVPLLFKLFQNKWEIDKEITLRKIDAELAVKTLELQAQNLATQLQLAELLASVRDAESVRSHDSAIQPDGVVNTMRALVRPVITFVLFGFWLAVKVALLVHLLTVENVPFVTAGTILLDEFTMGMISAIVAFWFSSRFIERHSNLNRPKK